MVCPKAKNEKALEAEKMFLDGMPMVDIAKKLGVSDGTVRSWKNRYGWGKSVKKKCNVAKKKKEKEKKENATLQKKKVGAPFGNQNSKGHSKGKGNPNPLLPPDRTTHGGYRAVFLDALDEDEQELIDAVPHDTDMQLIEEIQLFSIRERRILKAINKYREANGDVTVTGVSRSEDKRAFRDNEEEAEYERRIKEKVDSGDRLPGKEYHISTYTQNKDLIIVRLEQELSTVQSKKTKAIESLYRYRMERDKEEKENSGNAVVDDWISAVIGEDSDEE